MRNSGFQGTLFEIAKTLVWLLCLPIIAFLAVLDDAIKMGRK